MLTYSAGKLNIAIIGSCNSDAGRSQNFESPIYNIEWAIRDIAARQVASCVSPVLTPEMFLSVSDLNIIMATLTEHRY